MAVTATVSVTESQSRDQPDSATNFMTTTTPSTMMSNRTSLASAVAVLCPERFAIDFLNSSLQDNFSICRATTIDPSENISEVGCPPSEDITETSPEKPAPPQTLPEPPLTPSRTLLHISPSPRTPPHTPSRACPPIPPSRHSSLAAKPRRTPLSPPTTTTSTPQYPGKSLTSARRKFIRSHHFATLALQKRITQTYEIRQNALFFINLDVRVSHAWFHPPSRQDQRTRVGMWNGQPKGDKKLWLLGEAGAIHQRKLLATHAELAGRLRECIKDGCEKGEVGTNRNTRIAAEGLQTFLIRFKAMGRTREIMAKRMGVHGSGTRSVSAMCVPCEMAMLNRGRELGDWEKCWRHGGKRGAEEGEDGGGGMLKRWRSKGEKRADEKDALLLDGGKEKKE